jgi:hypothetical protein
MTHTDHTNPAAAHTPEPWSVDTNDGFLVTADSDGGMVAVTETEDRNDATCHANALRLVAAVNACKGLSTESLERGVVAGLRHALGTLLDAGGDLDAAIDGATDQFDDERARLDAAIRSARAALDDGMDIDVHELLAARRQIALVWSVEDVQQVRPDLTEEQAWEVLRQVERRHDADLGVHWLTLELTAEDEFGPVPETDAAEEEE